MLLVVAFTPNMTPTSMPNSFAFKHMVTLVKISNTAEDLNYYRSTVSLFLFLLFNISQSEHANMFQSKNKTSVVNKRLTVVATLF